MSQPSHTTSVCRSLALAITLLSGHAIAQKTETTVEQATRFIGQNKFDKAATTLEKIVADTPEYGEAWYWLGYSRHCLKDYESAIDANNHAIALGALCDKSLYNRACAESLLGKVEVAQKSLALAIEAGFLDFDQMQDDTDLARLRQAAKLPLPTMATWKIITHHGNKIRYQVLVPKDFDAERSYQAMLCFGPGRGGPLSGSWTIQEFWQGSSPSNNWIIVCPIAPDDGKGWLNHPAHHALNSLLQTVKKEYRVDGGKFHMFGFMEGCGPATTYSRMSKQYVRSLTLMSSRDWTNWKDSEMARFKQTPPLHFVAANDKRRLEMAERIQAACEKRKVAARLERLDDESAALPSLRGAELLRKIEAHQK